MRPYNHVPQVHEDSKLVDMGEKLLSNERNRVLRAVEQAKQLWPDNRFGEWVASELNSLLSVGLRFDQHGKIGQMLDALNSMYLDALENGTVSGDKSRTDWGHRVSALTTPTLRA